MELKLNQPIGGFVDKAFLGPQIRTAQKKLDESCPGHEHNMAIYELSNLKGKLTDRKFGIAAIAWLVAFVNVVSTYH